MEGADLMFFLFKSHGVLVQTSPPGSSRLSQTLVKKELALPMAFIAGGRGYSRVAILLNTRKDTFTYMHVCISFCIGGCYVLLRLQLADRSQVPSKKITLRKITC